MTFSVDKVPALVSSRIATGLSGRCLQAFGHRANGTDLTSGHPGRPQTARLPDSLHSLPMALQGVGALVSVHGESGNDGLIIVFFGQIY